MACDPIPILAPIPYSMMAFDVTIAKIDKDIITVLGLIGKSQVDFDGTKGAYDAFTHTSRNEMQNFRFKKFHIHASYKQPYNEAFCRWSSLIPHRMSQSVKNHSNQLSCIRQSNRELKNKSSHLFKKKNIKMAV